METEYIRNIFFKCLRGIWDLEPTSMFLMMKKRVEYSTGISRKRKSQAAYSIWMIPKISLAGILQELAF
ncbi:hypothetical protein NEOLI_001436 [Neolecta irregularis DAH-3]|uniref:Uncharacterized protein n=1 Tax=Neolecta irregularis (strain DAH-3) TaxID=1198029 RepID=A0A1U7LNJ1_NEOID|nr:hypothetical protein NEOLI_001436 [Neolecta irregularis DAH-3]|eukprot:OLL24198.1 hypothetical protein NEOLI_001436 [Neolecta irregularis DAH-3]